METEKIISRMNRAKQTKENLQKSKTQRHSIHVGGLISYCDETVKLCRLLLGMNAQEKKVMRITYKGLQGVPATDLIAFLIQEARQPRTTPVLKNMQKIVAMLLIQTGYTLKNSKKISKRIVKS